MSREWNEHEYVNAENLWSWIDKQARDLEIAMINAKDYQIPQVSALLMGRKEMLDTICDWLHENETTLGDVAKVWGLGVKDD